MSQTAVITWIVVIIIIILVIWAWWYFSNQSTMGTTTTTTTLSSDKQITSFSFQDLNPQVQGTVDNTNYAVTATVPNGTDVTQLTPTITVSDNATVSPASGTMEDFTNPVTYTVTAQDGSTQSYTVTVTEGTAATNQNTGVGSTGTNGTTGQ